MQNFSLALGFLMMSLYTIGARYVKFDSGLEQPHCCAFRTTSFKIFCSGW